MGVGKVTPRLKVQHLRKIGKWVLGEGAQELSETTWCYSVLRLAGLGCVLNKYLCCV